MPGQDGERDSLEPHRQTDTYPRTRREDEDVEDDDIPWRLMPLYFNYFGQLNANRASQSVGGFQSYPGAT